MSQDRLGLFDTPYDRREVRACLAIVGLIVIAVIAILPVRNEPLGHVGAFIPMVDAFMRNRMKRRFRELLRAALPEAGLPDHDHVLIGREGGIERDFGSLREELAVALSRAAEGKGDKPRPRKR